ncbi:metal-binding protein ZinT [Alphaproteobacteria bacterium KMM 3653]|uniref:Metal-binding protein ZinT n=1 Tax=Harenicola maris TaxID=2841044 RepID=A0AAP2CK81_9RHOB|nr:metal-binding protein ZinT [Harenicola maris]
MHHPATNALSAITLCTLMAFAAPAGAETNHNHDSSHEHSADDIYNGLFSDDQIKPRDLSDWEGDWQSLYPLLQDGTLDEVMTHKAESGERTAEEYKAYYDTGYATDVDRILIEGQEVTFFTKDSSVSGTYENDGYEILTYDSGSRGVRFIFAKTGGDAGAPDYFQFSDHRIAPEKSDHYHLYWGDDRAALLEEVTNWPTYYPAYLTGNEIVAQMLAH